jgi:ATP-dependent Lon protease
MTSEIKLTSKSARKPNTRQNQKVKEEKYKKNMSSDDDSDFITDDENEENDMDLKSYRSFLSDLFPSKYMKEKTENTVSSKSNDKKTPKKTKSTQLDVPPPAQKKSAKPPVSAPAHVHVSAKPLVSAPVHVSAKPLVSAPVHVSAKPLVSAPVHVSAKPALTRELAARIGAESKKQNKSCDASPKKPLNSKPTKRKLELESETEDDSDETLDEEDTDTDDEDDEDTYENGYKDGYEDSTYNSKIVKGVKEGQPSKFNIVFNVASLGDFEDYDEDDDEEYDIDEDEDSDYDEDSEDEDSEDEDENISLKVSEKDENSFTNEEAFTSFNSMIEGLTETQRQNPVVKEMILEIKQKELAYKLEIENKQKKQKGKNTRKFKTLLREKNVMNDVKFFKENMTQQQQQIVIKQMEEIKKFSDVEKPYRLQLLEANIPVAFKACAYKKINTLKYMEPGAGEYYKIKNWVDTFMQIPFGKFKHLPITIDDGIEKCHEFMENAKKTLDEAVFGLNDAKLQIMQMIGQLLVNPSAVGTAIAIKGPMGTGKTTLIKDGISKILGRDFAFIALGGATDSSFLEGHSYTYEGSLWGRIVDTIINCKCMNPVFYFDELDKVSDTPRGEEIIGILTHLTDTTQNSKFHDKYFAEIEFDLSRCLFIFSYNEEAKVNPILRDRMYRIHTKGYDQPQKTTIANNYLLPKIREQVKFNSTDIIIPEETVHHLITNHTEKEDGVRNLKRCLEIIHTKLNLYRLMKPGTNLFESDMSIKVEFPLTVTPEIVDKLIKKNTETGSWTNMYN